MSNDKLVSANIINGDKIGQDKIDGDKIVIQAQGETIIIGEIGARPVIKTESLPTEIIPAYPYEQFLQFFREPLSYKRFSTSGSILHIVFGKIVESQFTTVVLPVSQSFDFRQRGPKSVLASFEKVLIDGKYFFSAIDDLWPIEQRFKYAGIGHTHFLKLPNNSQDLHGIIFTVTTRDLSSNPENYGRYLDTPLDGIEYTLDKVIERAVEEKVSSIALPLLGTGYANVRYAANNAQASIILRQAVLGLTIHKLEKQLAQPNNSLCRATIVIYSLNPNSEEENVFWKFLVKFINLDDQGKSNQISSLFKSFQEFVSE